MIKILVALLCLITSARAYELPKDSTLSLTGEAKISVVFYVKVDQDSPYQGLLQFTPEEYAKLTPDDLQRMEIEQFASWKDNLARLQAAPPPTDEEIVDQKAQQAIDLQNQMDSVAAQIDVLFADPAVAAKVAAQSDAVEAVMVSKP